MSREHARIMDAEINLALGLTGKLFPDLVKSARVRANLSQRELAHYAGTTQGHVSLHENGRVAVTERTLERYALAMGRPFDRWVYVELRELWRQKNALRAEFKEEFGV